jgi:prepilin peptidase CpaA
MSLPEGVALFIAILACITDLRSTRIPNILTFSAIVAGIGFHAWTPVGHGWQTAVLGMLVGLLVFFPFFALGALGAGDVKLMAALGTWVGWHGAIDVALYGAVAGGVLAVIVASWHGYLGRALQNLKTLFVHWSLVGVRPLPELTLEQGKGHRLPYALPILAGLVVTLWRR